MYMELKRRIIEWLFDNRNQWQRVNSCVENFKVYIYDSDGNFLIGGENVYDFISKADELIYKGKEED